jgi:hypothetical protein
MLPKFLGRIRRHLPTADNKHPQRDNAKSDDLNVAKQNVGFNYRLIGF